MYTHIELVFENTESLVVPFEKVTSVELKKSDDRIEYRLSIEKDFCNSNYISCYADAGSTTIADRLKFCDIVSYTLFNKNDDDQNVIVFEPAWWGECWQINGWQFVSEEFDAYTIVGRLDSDREGGEAHPH